MIPLGYAEEHNFHIKSLGYVTSDGRMWLVSYG